MVQDVIVTLLWLIMLVLVVKAFGQLSGKMSRFGPANRGTKETRHGG